MNKLHIGTKVHHFKGNDYVITDFADHTERIEELVIYKGVDGKSHARPISLFMSEVDKKKYPNCTQKYRFQFIE